MADLIDRIQGIEPRPKIPVHQFCAAIDEYARGNLTRAQIVAAFDLQGSEATQAGQLADLIDAQTTAATKLNLVISIEDVFVLTEQPDLGLYDTKAKIATRFNL